MREVSAGLVKEMGQGQTWEAGEPFIHSKMRKFVSVGVRKLWLRAQVNTRPQYPLV